MTNASFQHPKPYLVMWDINISSQYDFSYLTSASFLVFPLLKIAAGRQVFMAGAVPRAGASILRQPGRAGAAAVLCLPGLYLCQDAQGNVPGTGPEPPALPGTAGTGPGPCARATATPSLSPAQCHWPLVVSFGSQI